LDGTLATVRRHLDPGGLFIFDVWNGPAVLAERPGDRQISVTNGPTRITRNTSAQLDIPRHLCRVCFDLERIDGNGRAEHWREEHVVRYYFPQELETVLRHSQLELLQLRSFPNEEAPADERAWNVIGVAQAACQESQISV
jgi:NADPH-dependent ferric siderophore reductase